MVAQFAKIERNPLLFPASNPISDGLGGLAGNPQNGLIGK
jgi:hypothetical protein